MIWPLVPWHPAGDLDDTGLREPDGDERLEGGAFLRAVLSRCTDVSWMVTLGRYARL